jgi:uncharacterized protein YeaO (DUF488 family)
MGRAAESGGRRMIKVRRVYDPEQQGEGAPFLVDRLWPRGVGKDSLHIQAWLKEAAPSNELRHWYSHDPQKWEEFQRRYAAELETNKESWKPLLEAARRGDVTLLYGSKERQHNNAVALKRYLEKQLAEHSEA